MARLQRLPFHPPADSRPDCRRVALRAARGALAGACVLALEAARAQAAPAATGPLPAELTAREVRSTLDKETIAEPVLGEPLPDGIVLDQTARGEN